MTCNYSTIEVEGEEIKYENVKVAFDILRIYTTFYYTYQLLYCTRHIQMTSNYSTIEVEAEVIVYINVISDSIYL